MLLRCIYLGIPKKANGISSAVKDRKTHVQSAKTLQIRSGHDLEARKRTEVCDELDDKVCGLDNRC